MTVVAEGVAFVPATCGELLQGVDSEGPILVSLPVELYGTVRVALTDDPEVSITPALPKAAAAVQLALARSGWRRGARVVLGGELPHSRGMASSTADVAGVIGGICATAGVAVTQRELLAMMVEVEPSDSSPWRGLWAIDHVGGSRALRLGPVPRHLWVAMVDGGESIATLDVHRTYGAGPRVPDDTVRATRWTDGDDIGRVATASAVRNQSRLPNPAFDMARGVAERVGAVGVCVAHSGSVCGVICIGIVKATEACDALTAVGLRAAPIRAWAPGLRVRVSATTRSKQWRPKT
jgi:L-threonine kinase